MCNGKDITVTQTAGWLRLHEQCTACNETQCFEGGAEVMVVETISVSGEQSRHSRMRLLGHEVFEGKNLPQTLNLP